MLRAFSKKFLTLPVFIHCIIFFILGFPAYFPLKSLINGAIPHWFDTAWGLLLGLENLEKIRLVGYQGGIPGVLYGPHWLWILSLVQIFNKNPAVIAFFVMFIPYFVILPFFLYKFKSVLGTLVVSLLWLAYILKYQSNSVHIWHIHLAPIIFLALIYTTITTSWKEIAKKDYVKMILSGFLTGLLLNIHMSFGAVILLAVFSYQFLSGVYYFLTQRASRRQVILLVILFIAGFAISTAPFFIFELRHNFLQTRAIISVLIQSFIYHTPMTGKLGLAKSQIMGKFIGLPLEILQLPQFFLFSFWLVITYYFGFILGRQQLKLTDIEKKLLLLLCICSGMVLLVYLTSQNPIWEYHFLGAEIIFLLLIGFFAHKSVLLRIALFMWVGWLSITMFTKIFTDKPTDPLTLPILSTKRHIVDSIYQDAAGTPFSAFAYSEAIYTFDYDYLFKWLGKDKYRYEPQNEPLQNTVYLITPAVHKTFQVDFTHYKTPPGQYQTEKEWQIAEGTTVIKRVKTAPKAP